MSRIAETTISTGPLAGATLMRIARPADWPSSYCQIEECPNLAPGGWRRSAPSLWSVQPAGQGFIGWRVACGRKHALQIWESELRED